MSSDATKAIQTAKSVAKTSPYASEITLQEVLNELDEADPWSPEFWVGINYAKTVLKALSDIPQRYVIDSNGDPSWHLLRNASVMLSTQKSERHDI